MHPDPDQGAPASGPTDANHEPPVTDAIERLCEEHHAILAVLDAIDAQASAVMKTGSLVLSIWARIVAFLQTYADKCHFFKEEQFLFPLLERRGISRIDRSFSNLHQDHQEGRRLVADMTTAVDGGERLRLANVARSLTKAMRSHLAIELGVLYPLARRMLTLDDLAQLEAAFDAFDTDGICEYVDLARRVCAESGVEFERHAS